MGRHYESANAICPFYAAEKEMTIRCEGPEANSMTEVTFRSPGRKESYKSRFCECMEWRRCPLARGLWSKY